MAIKLEFIRVYSNVYLSFMAEVLDRDDIKIGIPLHLSNLNKVC